MCFSITTESFDFLDEFSRSTSLKCYQLRSSETGEFIQITPHFGGILNQLVLRKAGRLISLIKAPRTIEAMLGDTSYASAFLLPFASRIPNGLYTFEGCSHKLPINDITTNCSLHGFVHQKAFSVLKQETTDEYAHLQLTYTYDGSIAGYPFPFTFDLSYRLVRNELSSCDSTIESEETCTLEIEYCVTNSGHHTCPIHFGWHPYFVLGKEPLDDWQLTLPARSEVRLDEQLQPLGYNWAVGSVNVPLRGHSFDNVYKLESNDSGYSETELYSPNEDLRLLIGQQTGKEKLPYLICYIPPERDCIAIEPQSANINSFNTNDGLSLLQPNDKLFGTIKIRLA